LIEQRKRSAGWRVVPRVVLYVPRLIAKAVFAVPRAGLRTYHRLRLKARFLEIFFNDDRTIGVFPSFFVESGFGLNAGVRYIHREIFGSQGTLRLRTGYGGTSNFVVSGGADTGAFANGRVQVDVDGVYRVAPRDRFYGYGNRDLEAIDMPAADIDPLTTSGNFETRYRQAGFQLDFATAIRLAPRLRVVLTETYDRRDFKPFAGSSPSIDDVFDVAALPGYSGTSHLYSQLELRFDTRRVTRPYLWEPAHSTGWRLAGRLGYQAGFEDDPSKHVRWELDAQRVFDLYGGDRVLVLRLLSENVAGDVDRIPFVSLPTLGGPELLRGYQRGRFRDKHSLLGTIEYRYPLLRMLSGFLFVDAGQVFRRASDFELADSRLGYGIGIQLHSQSATIGRFFIASSTDGGLFVRFSLSPALDTGSRGEQVL
jgi:hypothetical protein